MTRSLHSLAAVAVFIFACDSHPTAPRQAATNAPADPSAEVQSLGNGANPTMIAFGAMYGVDDAFVNDFIRGVKGDELPWTVHRAVGALTTSGHLTIQVRGLVFSDAPEVPPELRGINDEEAFRGLVSCLVSTSTGIGTQNIVTAGFPATRSGNANIDAQVTLPEDCVAPIIFVMSGSEDKWFAVTGAATQ